jgi:hypothetical protein
MVGGVAPQGPAYGPSATEVISGAAISSVLMFLRMIGPSGEVQANRCLLCSWFGAMVRAACCWRSEREIAVRSQMNLNNRQRMRVPPIDARTAGAGSLPSLRRA